MRSSLQKHKTNLAILLTKGLLATIFFVDAIQARVAADVCGAKGTAQAVTTSINIGCKGVGNPITDATFAIIRVLSDGVGLVIIGSIIVGGIQYTASRGNPQATAIAVKRIQNTFIALVVYIFGYAFLNYIIPAGFLHT